MKMQNARAGCETALLVLVLSVIVGLSGCEENPGPSSNTPPIDPADCPTYDPANYCANTCTGLTPISDLGTGFYLGYKGGLYPGGSNERPASHSESGVAEAGQIAPLGPSGTPDSVNGRIVMLGIGMSNSKEEFKIFQTVVDTFSGRNPYLRLVNGAQAGKDIDKMDAAYFQFIDDTLAALGLSPLQVQVIWFKQAEANPTDPSFPGYPNSLRDKFRTAMNQIRASFPNARLAYVASRIYGNYMATTLNPEPYAYYTGWADKFLIEDQINGDPALSFSGPGPQAPWLSWGVYMWADGARPRSDGLAWICPDDYLSDGIHPSEVGRLKVSQMLFEFFTTDETTIGWFLR